MLLWENQIPFSLALSQDLCEGVERAGSFSPVKMRGYRHLTRSVLLIITVYVLRG